MSLIAQGSHCYSILNLTISPLNIKQGLKRILLETKMKYIAVVRAALTYHCVAQVLRTNATEFQCIWPQETGAGDG